MPDALKVRKIGNSLGLILPQPVVEAMSVEEGDELYVSQTAEGIQLTPYDPEFASAVEDARAFMRSHRNAFRELSK